MKISKVCALVFLLTVGLAASLHAQLIDGIQVNFPREVIVNNKVLPAGDYEIRKVTNSVGPVLRFFNRDEMMYETPVLPITVHKNDVQEEPKVVMHTVGDNVYLTEIWILPDKHGYEVPLPKSVRALEKELEERNK